MPRLTPTNVRRCNTHGPTRELEEVLLVPQEFIHISREPALESGSLEVHLRKTWPQPRAVNETAAAEYPWRRIPTEEANMAHGVGGNAVPELDDVAGRRPLHFRNEPPLRGPCPIIPEQKPFREPDGSLWTPGRGRVGLDNLRTHFDFTAEHGTWVPYRMQQLGLTGRVWHLSPHEQNTEIIFWMKCEMADHARAGAMLEEGKSMQLFRPTVRPWILPEASQNPKAVGRIYDTRGVGAALERGDTDFEITLLAMTSSGNKWNKPLLRSMLDASKCPDQRGVQFILDQGTIFPYTGNYDCTLMPNARSFWLELEFAAKTTRTEVAAGILDGYYAGFPPFSVWKKSKQGVTIVWKHDRMDTKPRGTGDLTGLGTGFETSFPNAGFELKRVSNDNPKLEYPTNTTFADDCATVKPAYEPGEFLIQQFDWQAWYRQLARHVIMYFLYCMCTVAEGWTVDMFSLFGDGSSVVTSNCTQNILIWLIRWMMIVEMDLGDDCRQWVDRLLAQTFMTSSMRTWITTRAEIFKCPDAPSWRALQRAQALVQMKRFYNLVPLALCAYFDDKMTGSGVYLSDMASRAIWKLVSQGKILDSVAKATRSTENACKLIVQVEADGSRSWQPDTTVADGTWHPVILGKEFIIATQIRRDQPSRIRMVIWLTMQIIEAATAAKTRLVLIMLLERVRGQWNFVLDSAKEQRALLSSLTACIVTALRGGRRDSKFGIKQTAKLAAARGASMAEIDASETLQWEEWGMRFFAPFSHKAEFDMKELCRAIRSANGSAWAPRRSPVPLEEQMTICVDSAGFSETDDGVVDIFRYAACWVFAVTLLSIPYMQELWDQEVLRVTHSTAQEFANMVACLKACAEKYHWVKFFWVCLDSKSAMYISRRMAARKPGMEAILEEFRVIMLNLASKGIRVGFLWNERKLGSIPDDISKDEMEAARAKLLIRCPDKSLDLAPTPRARNVLNRPAPASTAP